MNDRRTIEVAGEPRKPRLLFVGIEGLAEWPGLPGIVVAGIVDVYGEWGSSSVKPQGLPAQLQHCRLFASLEEALELSAPDTAFVCVSNDRKTSFPVMERLLRENIDVLVKKLRLHAMSDVERLSELSKRGPGRLFVGEHYRYMPSVRALKRLVDEDELGAVEQITWRCRLPYEIHDWMKSYRHLVLEDLSYHHFSVLHDLFGFEPLRLYAHSFEPAFSRAGTRTVASVLAETADYRLNYETVWCSKREPYSYLGEVTVEGSKASAVLTDTSLHQYSPLGRNREVVCPAPRYDGPWGLLEHWLDTYGSGQRTAAVESEKQFSLGAEAKAKTEAEAEAEAKDTARWLPYTFERFEPVLLAIYRAVESAKNHVVR
ncbi:Gfo/Idh/MocA family oxidoreductase [Paenibacillus rhizovicinus]|uniref:Gfo/Idh/MocA family oxidoreductase n=1 Tax=Paenibacillus rhizovicinus TaxID=2704463 RepID=A0A6C0P4B9_9BACL|nr:Gfo/Idh/MocA family oxidoreductase [Paenibacillus rhizovicinus]QHW33368.1 Gfo/Idh/MocA family oxidoreductase [Paenibacillus rhizovicinus]